MSALLARMYVDSRIGQQQLQWHPSTHQRLRDEGAINTWPLARFGLKQTWYPLRKIVSRQSAYTYIGIYIHI
jgi:hypothetical protein